MTFSSAVPPSPVPPALYLVTVTSWTCGYAGIPILTVRDFFTKEFPDQID